MVGASRIGKGGIGVAMSKSKFIEVSPEFIRQIRQLIDSAEDDVESCAGHHKTPALTKLKRAKGMLNDLLQLKIAGF